MTASLGAKNALLYLTQTAVNLRTQCVANSPPESVFEKLARLLAGIFFGQKLFAEISSHLTAKP